MDGNDRQSHGAKRRSRGHHRTNDDDDDDVGDGDDEEERAHFVRVCDSYRQYATFHITRELGMHRRRLRSLMSSSSESSIEYMLPSSLVPNTPKYDERRSRLRDAALRNQYFLDNALRHSDQETSQDSLRRRRLEREGDGVGKGWEGEGGIVDWVTEDDISKVDSVLRSVARDWSKEGREERMVAYDRIVRAVTRYAPLLPSSGDDVQDGGDRRRASSSSAVSASAIAVDGPSNHDDDDADAPNPVEGLRGTTSTTSGGGQLAKKFAIRVAVPGSGLGRLAWELYSHGYSVEGSDFSLPMLLASDFILNGRCHGSGDGADSQSSLLSPSPKFAISPWMAETKNVISLENRLRTVIVPDVDPGTAVDTDDHRFDDVDHDDERPEFTMLAGEFLHLYSNFLPGGDDDDGRIRPGSRDDDDPSHIRRRKFHVVACSYFLDTAPSLPHYLHAMYHMLEDGGLFVHFGPLMYHWSGHGGLVPGDLDGKKNRGRGGGADDDGDDEYDNGSAYDRRNDGLDMRYLHSIDYTWEEVRDMILNCGFVILEEETGIPAKYASDSRSMMGVVYGCVFCVARKEEGRRGGGEGSRRGEWRNEMLDEWTQHTAAASQIDFTEIRI